MSDILATNLMLSELLFFSQTFNAFRMKISWIHGFYVSFINFSPSCVFCNRSELKKPWSYHGNNNYVTYMRITNFSI